MSNLKFSVNIAKHKGDELEFISLSAREVDEAEAAANYLGYSVIQRIAELFDELKGIDPEDN